MSSSKKPDKLVTILTLFKVKDVSEHDQIVETLRRGLDINIVDSGGRTLLMEAVIRKDHWLAETLIAKGADVNLHDLNGWTALHFAAQNSDVRSSTLLVECGAEVNSKDSHGNNVIWRAVFDSRGESDVIDFLMKKGADPTEHNASGISAIDIAKTIPFVNVKSLFE